MAVKLAPSVSRIKTPLSPELAVTVPAVVAIGFSAVPMPVATPVCVDRATVPVPTFNRLPASWVIEPPVPARGLAVTVMVPPLPVVMLFRLAVAVAALELVTVICTAFAVVFVVMIDVPAAMVKLPIF